MISRMKSSAHGRFVHALVLSALLLFGALAQTVHEATVAHAVCPEHGELLDVARSAAIASHTHDHDRGATVPDCESTGPRAAPSSEESGHDECWFATLLKPGSAPCVESLAHFVPPRGSWIEVIDARVRVAAIPTLSFAPKHGPPARRA